MRTQRVVLCLVMLFATAFAAGIAGVPAASAADAPVLEFAPGVLDKLEGVDKEFTLDWGIYRNT